jgi:hypothetical protein
MMDITKDAIQEFWIWFESIASDLLAYPTNKNLIKKIDEHVYRLGRYDWEVGPWNDGLYYFAISPNLDIEKATTARRIIEMAPICKGWHFLSSKPPKAWTGIWKMTNETGDEILIDSNDWKYVLYRFNDDTFDIDIVIDSIKGNLDTQYLAADIALTGYLGEENFMRLIKNIQIVNEFEVLNKDKATLLKYIKSHMDDISK